MGRMLLGKMMRGLRREWLKLLVSKFYGQATKGTRWMPWHFEAKKDVASCEKPR